MIMHEELNGSFDVLELNRDDVDCLVYSLGHWHQSDEGTQRPQTVKLSPDRLSPELHAKYEARLNELLTQMQQFDIDWSSDTDL